MWRGGVSVAIRGGFDEPVRIELGYFRSATPRRHPGPVALTRAATATDPASIAAGSDVLAPVVVGLVVGDHRLERPVGWIVIQTYLR